MSDPTNTKQCSSPCRKCKKRSSRNCRNHCAKLKDFVLWLDNHFSPTYGIADTTDDGYRLLGFN